LVYRIGNVRFTPESGHVRCSYRCPLWANSGHAPNRDNLYGALYFGIFQFTSRMNSMNARNLFGVRTREARDFRNARLHRESIL
jgi:hypothetical protein